MTETIPDSTQQLRQQQRSAPTGPAAGGGMATQGAPIQGPPERTVTNLGLKVALVDEDRNIIAVTGSVPGAKNGIIRIELQKRTDAEAAPVLFGVLPVEEEAPEAAPEAPEVIEDVAVAEEAADDVVEDSSDEVEAGLSPTSKKTEKPSDLAVVPNSLA